jgi:hypothetical protein
VSYCSRNSVSLSDQQQQVMVVEGAIEINKNICFPCDAISDILVQPVDPKITLQPDSTKTYTRFAVYDTTLVVS